MAKQDLLSTVNYRLVCHIQIHCSQAAIITFVRPPLSCAELSLPLPQSRRLWSAPSAEKWKEIFVSLPPSNPQSQAHSPVLLLGEISELGSLPSIYDSELAHFVVVHSLLSLVLEYKQTQSIFAVDSHVSRKENLLAEDAGYNRFSRIAQDLRISYESSPSPRVLDWSFLLELTLMHLNAPCDQIELLLGKEGEQNMHASYQNLSQWVSTVQARRAVWHAGQMLRLLRLRPLDQLNDFDAFGAYHASLCLLAYGMLSDTIPGIQADRSTCIFDADDIFLDSAESLKSQRWITLNRGIPMISGIGSRGEGGRSERITLTSSRALLQSTTQLIRIKFAAKGQKISHFVYNICQLLHILGQLEQQSSSS